MQYNGTNSHEVLELINNAATPAAVRTLSIGCDGAITLTTVAGTSRLPVDGWAIWIPDTSALFRSESEFDRYWRVDTRGEDEYN